MKKLISIYTFLLFILLCPYDLFAQTADALKLKETGNNFYLEGNYDKAEEYYLKAIKADIAYAPAYNNLGNIYLKQNSFVKAINYFSKAIENNNTDPAFYINRAFAYEKTNENKLALSDYNYAIQLSGDNDEYYRKRGLFHTGTSNFDKAISDFNKAILLNPENAENYYHRGIAKLSSRDNMEGQEDLIIAANAGNEKAQKIIAEVLFPQVENSEYLALCLKAALKYKLNKYPEAIIDLDKAISMNPKAAKPYLLRGLSKIQQKNMNSGCKDLKTARSK
mgnify:CR=1 FL=1